MSKKGNQRKNQVTNEAGMADLAKLQELLSKNGLADARLVEQLQKYIQEMDASVKNMESELKQIKQELADIKADKSELSKNALKDLENDTSSFKHFVDDFKKYVCSKASEILNNFKSKGIVALDNAFEKMGLKNNFQKQKEMGLERAAKMQKSIDKLNVINKEINNTITHAKNIGNAIAGRQLQETPNNKQQTIIKMLCALYESKKRGYINMSERADKMLDKLEKISEKASVIQKLSNNKQKIMEDDRKDEQSKDKILKAVPEAAR